MSVFFQLGLKSVNLLISIRRQNKCFVWGFPQNWAEDKDLVPNILFGRHFQETMLRDWGMDKEEKLIEVSIFKDVVVHVSFIPPGPHDKCTELLKFLA